MNQNQRVLDVFKSFMKECSFKVREFEDYVKEKEEYMEELFLESLNKLKNPSEGGCVVLPKTPAFHRGKRTKTIKQSQDDIATPIQETEKENSSPTVGRSGRAASKAASAKIKVSQQLLNDLMSKRRRPDGSEELQPSGSNKKNRQAERDSGIYSSCHSSTSPNNDSKRKKVNILVPNTNCTNASNNDTDQDMFDDNQENNIGKTPNKNTSNISATNTDKSPGECSTDNKNSPSSDKSHENNAQEQDTDAKVTTNLHDRETEVLQCNKNNHKSTFSPARKKSKLSLDEIVQPVDSQCSDSQAAEKFKSGSASCISKSDVSPTVAQITKNDSPTADSCDGNANSVTNEMELEVAKSTSPILMNATNENVESSSSPIIKSTIPNQDLAAEKGTPVPAQRSTRTKTRLHSQMQDKTNEQPELQDKSGSTTAGTHVESETKNCRPSRGQKRKLLSEECETSNNSDVSVHNQSIEDTEENKAEEPISVDHGEKCEISEPEDEESETCDGDNEEEEEEDEEEEEEEDEEEEEIIVEAPKRMTRSKARLQQENLPVPAPRTVYPATSKSKAISTEKAVTGKFSPKPFGKTIGVKKLVAAYSEHVSASKPASVTPLRNARQPSSSYQTPDAHKITSSYSHRNVGRVSSTSRLDSTSRITPLTYSKQRSVMGGNRSMSSDAHHYKTMNRVLGTPSHQRHRNIVTGVTSFLSTAVQPARPTRGELEEQRQEELRKKREKEDEIRRKKEEIVKSKGIEAKKKNEERMRKVQEARLAKERKIAEQKELFEKEKKMREEQKREMEKEKKRKLKEEALKKKLLEKRKLEEAEERRRLEIEERKRLELEERKRLELEEKKRLELEERKRLELEERKRLELEERKKLELEERKRLELEEKKKKELEAEKQREAALKRQEELRKEAARKKAEEEQQQRLKLEVKQQDNLNETYDVNKTYTAAPKTPHSTNSDSYEMTPAIPNNPNCYGIDDLKSDDESDNECEPRKPIPKWASSRKELSRALTHQEYYPPELDIIFPRELLFHRVDLCEIFRVQKPRYKIRSSSAQWKTPPHKIFSLK